MLNAESTWCRNKPSEGSSHLAKENSAPPALQEVVAEVWATFGAGTLCPVISCATLTPDSGKV